MANEMDNSTTVLPKERLALSVKTSKRSCYGNGSSKFGVQSLQSVVEEIRNREEVSEVLQEILENVEWADHLNKELENSCTTTELQHKLTVITNELEERRAYDAHQLEEMRSLADVFVGELWALSFKITEMEYENSDFRQKLANFDSIKQQLERSEELVRSLQRTMSFNRDAYNNPLGKIDLVPTQPPIENLPTIVSLDETVITQVPAVPTNPEIPKESDFLTLDEPSLLNIFSFLEATDVLNTALVSIAFYSRIDSLFGLGGATFERPSTGENATGENLTSSNVGVSGSIATGTSEVSVNSVSGQVANQENKKHLVQGAVVLQGSALPPSKPHFGTTAILPEKSTPKLGPQQPRNALANVFSMLGQQPRAVVGGGKAPSGGSQGPVTKGGEGSTEQTVQTSENAKAFASMANAIADKLTPAELNVILKMTEDLRAKDKLIVKTKAEREDLAARLEGTEAVKDFLISKVRDTERSLKKCQEDTVKIMQQTSSDQEVISFLDSRVKELEVSLQRVTAELKAKTEEFQKADAKAKERQKIVEDMLQFDRQQLADSEREWRSTKKVLVKEVKHCRGQLLALQAERDSYRQKNLQLKQALLSLNTAGSSDR